MMTDKDNISYMAGLFDGEGCIMTHAISKKQLYPYLTVQMSNTNPKAVTIFRDTFGGSIYTQKLSTGRNNFVWKVTGKIAEVTLLGKAGHRITEAALVERLKIAQQIKELKHIVWELYEK